MRKSILILGVGLLGVLILSVGLWYWFSYGGRAARLAESSDPAQRLQAVRELRGNSSGLALRILRRLADDDERKVAVQAVQALGEAGSDAADALLDVLERSPAGQIRGEAAAALGLCKGADAALLGRKLREDPDGEARAGAAKGLARLRDRASLKYLVEALKTDSDPRVLRMCLLAIQKTIIVRFRYDVNADKNTRARQADFIESTLRDKKLL